MRLPYILSLCFFLFASIITHAKSFKIIETSNSKKSLILDVGDLQGVKTNDEGFFYSQDGIDSPKLEKIAKGRAIKVQSGHSYWFLTEIYKSDFIIPNNRLIFFGFNETLQGRKTFKLKKKLIVLNPNADTSIDQLSYKSDQFNKTKPLVKTEFPIESDKQITSTTIWENDGSRLLEEGGKEVPIKKIAEFEDDLDLAAINKEFKDDIMGSTTQGSVDKVNRSRGGLKGIYRDQKRDPHVRLLKKKGWTSSVYEKYHYDRRDDVLVNPKAKAKIEREGPLWSAEMNDVQLRNFFMSNGLAEEKRRQDHSLKNRKGHEVFVRYAWNTTDNTSESDPTNQGQGYSLVIGYDFHLMRAVESLESWSLDFFWEQGVDYYDLGNINAKGQIALIGGYLNYYFYNLPSTIKQFIWFFGGGLKFGSAKLENDELSQDYSYQAQVFPSYQLGIKYRFDPGDEVDEGAQIGLGLSFLVQLSLMSLSTSDQLVDDISGSIEAEETKFSFGINFIF